jgi:putative ATP-binding cassette transporter
MPIGTLAEQLCFPRSTGELDLDCHGSCTRLNEALDRANLPALSAQQGGFQRHLNWAQILSVGEQQRLAFARLLVYSPRLAFLDEATNALDSKNERAMYEALREKCSTNFSVGHRPSLFKFHTHVLLWVAVAAACTWT